MGYTNYWTPNKYKLNMLTVFPPEVLDDVRRIKEKFNEEVLTKKRNTDFVEGDITDTSIQIKGPGEWLDINLKKDPSTGDRFGIDSWTFCKTAREPYDAVVKCVLMALTYHGLLIDWDHDDNGLCTEHRKAVALAKRCDIPVVHHYYPATGQAK